MRQAHTFLPHLPLHTILTTISHATEGYPRKLQAEDAATLPRPATKFSEDAGERAKEGKLMPCAFMLALPNTDRCDPTLVKVQTFKWTSLALGWYLSMIWGWVYASDSSRVWVGTNIRLFNVLSQRNEISLRSPKGAVDAVGNTIAKRIGSLNLTSKTTMKEV